MPTATTAVRERPILFKGAMVRAIIAGTKTQTRRTTGLDTYNEAPDEWHVDPAWEPGPAYGWSWKFAPRRGCRAGGVLPCPYGKRGDRLWVKETCFDNDHGREWIYRADGEFDEHFEMVEGKAKWTPSILCPRRASRLLLEVADVRLARLQAITEADAIAEGVTVAPSEFNDPAREAFCELWESINGAGSWDANPWVWAVTFRRVSP